MYVDIPTTESHDIIKPSIDYLCTNKQTDYFDANCRTKARGGPGRLSPFA